MDGSKGILLDDRLIGVYFEDVDTYIVECSVITYIHSQYWYLSTHSVHSVEA